MIASSFFLGNPVVEALDVVFGLLILADFTAQLFISRSLFGELVHPLGIADVIVILSFLVPTPGENFGAHPADTNLPPMSTPLGEDAAQ